MPLCPCPFSHPRRSAAEGGHVYAWQGPVPIYLGREADPLARSPGRLAWWLSSRDFARDLLRPAPYYVGLCYRGEEERLMQLLPLFLRPWGERVERERRGRVKRLFLTLPTPQVKSAIYLLDVALELLMYLVCQIDGYAHGKSLAQVKEETLDSGVPPAVGTGKVGPRPGLRSLGDG